MTSITDTPHRTQCTVTSPDTVATMPTARDDIGPAIAAMVQAEQALRDARDARDAVIVRLRTEDGLRDGQISRLLADHDYSLSVSGVHYVLHGAGLT